MANKAVPTEDPKPAAETATTVDPPATALARWPWIASAILAAVAITIFIVTLVNGWNFVTGSDETQERDDWEQLLGLIGRVDTLVTLILGAVLGVGVGAAKQSGDTKTAAAAATVNANEAAKQNTVARENQQIAATNKEAADQRLGDLERLLDFAQQVDASANARQGDESRFAGGEVVRLWRGQQQASIPGIEMIAPVDPFLEQLGGQAGRLVDEMRAKYT